MLPVYPHFSISAGTAPHWGSTMIRGRNQGASRITAWSGRAGLERKIFEGLVGMPRCDGSVVDGCSDLPCNMHVRGPALSELRPAGRHDRICKTDAVLCPVVRIDDDVASS